MPRRIVTAGMGGLLPARVAGPGTQLVALAATALSVEAVTRPIGGQDADEVVVILGPGVRDPVAVVYALRPSINHIAVVVLGHAPQVGVDPLALITGSHVHRVPPGEADQLGPLVDRLFDTLAGQRRHRATRASAQVQLAAAGARIEQQLGERLFGELLSGAPIGVVLTDTAGRLLAWNARAADLLHLQDPASLHTDLTSAFDAPDAVAAHLGLSGRHMEGERYGPATVERTDRYGVTAHLRLTGQPTVDDTGRPRLLVLIEDLTALVDSQRQLARRSRETAAAAEVAAALAAAEPLDHKLHRCVTAIVTHLELSAAAVWTVGADAGTPVWRAGAGPAADALRNRLPATAVDASPARSVSYTLVSDDKPIGVLTVLHPGEATAAALAPLPAMARQIAVGIHQDILNERVRSVAEALQRPLLPPTLPDIAAVDLAARYHPYGDGLHVGGDFYDAFALPDGRHVLALGDICGKGPEAAAATGLVRHTIWTAAQHRPDPDYVLPLVNRALLRIGDARFCTLVYGLLDSRGDRCPQLSLTCAGHPPPVVARAGEARLAQTRGTLLGVTPRLRLQTEVIPMVAGTVVVCYTDGFTEGGGAYVRQPADIAAQVAALSGGRPEAASVADTLVALAAGNESGQARDDLALLVAVFRETSLPS